MVPIPCRNDAVAAIVVGVMEGIAAAPAVKTAAAPEYVTVVLVAAAAALE